jgi:RalA-binding protein 1
VSDPAPNPKASDGSPTSMKTPMPATAPQHRVDGGSAQRTASIDSAISSMSGSQNPHHDPAAGTPDVATVIQAAGSPEAAILHLLKEKQSQAAQNAQLWRLVDKQRAMILGLNKDLERALKDKERYRKKAKETIAQLANPSPVESANGGAMSEPASAISERGRGEAAKTNLEGLIDAAPHRTAPTPSQAQNPGSLNVIGATQAMPSPTKHAFQAYNPDSQAAGFKAGQQQRKAGEETPYNTSAPPSRSLPSEPPRGPPPKAPLPKAPTSATSPPASPTGTEPSPSSYQNLKQFPNPPPRKGPPAPLNLGKKNEASSHLHQSSGKGDESDSDYDDILEVDEIPAFTERGRRKTREDDDREREVAAMKEAELRSLSKKSRMSKSRTPKSPKESTFDPRETTAMSPRQTVPIAPPAELMSSPDSNTGSLAGMLASSRVDERSSAALLPPLLSPGLPTSPRPIDRGTSPLSRQSNNSAMISPPVSPRGITAFPGVVPLSPRAPRQAIPLPPNTPLSLASPGLALGGPPQLISPAPLVITKKTPEPTLILPSNEYAANGLASGNTISKDLVTEEYPDLLLPPNALPSIDVKVASSRLKPSRASMMFPKNFEDDPVFTLAIFSRATGRELWRVEKDSASLAALDQTLKQSPSITARAPEKSLFSGHAPAKVDARRAALDTYLDEILNTQMDTATALEICKYLSTNAVEPNAEEMNPRGELTAESPVKAGPGGRPLKNGYLTKKGKNFGGWKARFFVLDGPVFKYYESPGGPHLGAIKLQNAQIGKQQQHQESAADLEDMDNQYRHAFLILEPKRKDSSSHVRHVLCAESDKERDQWVDALLQYVDYKDSDEDDHAHSSQHSSHHEHGRSSPAGSTHTNGSHGKKKPHAQGKSHMQSELTDDLRGISYEDTKQGSAPVGARSKHSGTPSPPVNGHDLDAVSQSPQSQTSKSISAPKNAQVIQDAGAWGNKHNLAPLVVEDKKQKKRSFFGFGSSKPRPAGDSPDVGPNDSNSNLSQMAYEQHGPIRPVFGAPLAEAVRYSHPADVPNIELPAVVYRCIEYLDAQNAAMEEGIFRLSGSNVVIKQLRERFNTEGDVNLVTDEQYYDIHAVASLLKLYLRELPTTILTRELHLEFLAVTELRDINDKVSALNVLVHRLPSANNSLLRNLAGFLINVVNHSDHNKMTVRNVGIVFSPTLNIPAPVFALFLQQYDDIFDQEPTYPRDQSSPVEHTVSAPSLTPEDIRSPRQQIFQNLPTPSYDQQTFGYTQTFPQPQHHLQQLRPGHDTGFTPLQPSYETQYQPFPTMGGPEYNSNRTPTISVPAYDQFNGGNEQYRKMSTDSSTGTKSKRRESSMFGLSMTPRKGSTTKLRDDRKLTPG